MPDREDLGGFIRSSFRSVWSFEIALLLKRQQERWSHADVVAALRASDLVVSQSIESLQRAGLVDADEEGRFAYAPVNKNTAEFMDKAERLYESRPDYVRRLIVSQGSQGLTAFANAFRLRDD
jgi:DNA-binding transcriptional ArsR family regulator